MSWVFVGYNLREINGEGAIAIRRETTCCFTGHRPDKLPWGTDEGDPRCIQLKYDLEDALQGAYDRGYRHFICGMARGCDLYFGQAVLELRSRHPDVTLEAARPYEKQASGWPSEEQATYQKLLDQCDYESLIQSHYDRGCFMRRNRYMVDRSALLIAAYDGEPKGGTASTVLYGLRQTLTLHILNITKGEPT